MSFSNFETWTPKCNFSKPNVLFHLQDEKDIRSAFTKFLTNPTSGCHSFYKILPNGRNHTEIITSYIAKKKNIQFDTTEWQPSCLETIDELCRGLKIFSSVYSAHAIDQLRHQLYLPETKASLNIIQSVCLELFPILEKASPFIFSKVEESNKAWWSKPPLLKSKVQNIRSMFKAHFGKIIPKELMDLNEWLVKLEKNLDLLTVNERIGWNTEDAVLQASAYCAAMAERQLLLGNPVLSMLLTHRGADLLLFSLCIAENLIELTKNGGAGAYKFDSKQITLIDSLSALSGRISADTNRDILLGDLNKCRNQLIYAHYLTGLTYEQAADLIISLRPYLEKLGGPDWTRARDSFFSPPILDSLQIMNTNNCMESLFQEVVLP